MKKICAIFLAIIMCTLIVFQVLSASSAYDPCKIIVSNMSYSMSELTSGSLKIECDIELIDKSISNQKFVFLSVVKYDGKILSRDFETGSLTEEQKPHLINTLTIPQVQNYSELAVESYFWDSLTNAKVIAPMSVYGTSDNNLKYLYINGKKISSIRGKTEFEYVFPASYMRTPDIVAIPSDNSSIVAISPITELPCEVEINVTPQVGSSKKYILNLGIEDGTVSDAYMTEASGANYALSTAKLVTPVYNGLTPDDSGFDSKANYPSERTLVYTDRDVYYYKWPEFLNDAVSVQTSLELIRNNSNFQDSANANAKLGGFTIDRSADIYLYASDAMPDWAYNDGFVLYNDARVNVFFPSAGNSEPTIHSAYKRTIIVPEGETREVRLGGAKNANGKSIGNYYVLVDFISPNNICALDNVQIDGISNFEFDENVTEYDVILNEGITSQPEIRYDVLGVGTTVTEMTEGTVPGKKTVTVASKDGSSQKTYIFNFKEFVTKLNQINLDGNLINGFDSSQYEYTVTLKDTWNAEKGLPEITVSAPEGVEYEFIRDAIPNDDGEPMIAIIKVTSEKGIDKEYTVNFVVDPNPPLYPQIAEIKSVSVNGEAIDMKYMDDSNTYYKYLPYGSEYPRVSAMAEEDTGADIRVVQADSASKEAKITVVSYDEATSKEYTIKFIIASSPSTDAKVSLKNKVLQKYYAVTGTDDNSAKTTGNYVFAADIVGTRSGYFPYMGFMQLDLTELKDCDLSGEFIFNVTKGQLTVGENATDRANGLKAEVSFYDMTGYMDWSGELDANQKTVYTADAKDATKSKDIAGNVEGKDPFAVTYYGHTNPINSANKFQMNITEFVRKCVRENNLTPTIGVRVELPELSEFNYTSAYATANLNMAFDNVDYYYIECKK